MSRLLGQVRVVEVQIADQGAVGEGSQVRESRVARAPQRRAVGNRDRLRDPAGDHAGPGCPRAEDAGQAVQNAALDFVDDLCGQVFVTERLRVGGEAIGNHAGSPPKLNVLKQNCTTPVMAGGPRFCYGIWTQTNPWSSYMAAKFVTVTVAERLATVTLNNPPSNLLSTPVLKELDQTFGQLEADDAVRVIILTASGKFFSPGADIKELADLNTMHQGSELSGRGQALLNRIERFDKPVIAALNGACLGGGLELAMACHMRVAAAGILLGLPEIKLGLIPGFGGTQRLPRIIGPSKAAELILTGETVNSEEALTLGLVNRVVPPEEILLTAQKLTGMITAKGRLATQAALRAIRTGLDSPLAEGLAREAELFGELCETPDKKEGTRAFLEKRPPRFS